MAELSVDEVRALLAPRQVAEAIPQNGPLRWYDREMRCARKGCSSPTYAKVEYVPLCMMHALRKLNGLVIEVTELRKKDLIA